MSLERELKEAFMRHQDDVRAREDAWTGVEKSVRRARARRVGLVSGIAVLAIAAAAVFVPKLVGDEPARGFDVPGATSTPSAPASPSAPAGIDTSDWVARAGVQSSFALKIPTDWRGGWFEGHWDFGPKALPGAAEGGDTFFVDVTTVHQGDGTFEDDAKQGTPTSVRIDDRRATRWERVDGSTHTVLYEMEWLAENRCPSTAETCTSDLRYPLLRIRLSANTAALWIAHAETGEAVVGTLRYYDGSTPVHGRLAAGTPADANTKALVRFMDARVEGIGADELMTDNASGQYAERENSRGLYGPEPGEVYKEWTLTARNEADANSVEFEVTIDGIRETIGVGPGKSFDGTSRPAVIRFSTLH